MELYTKAGLMEFRLSLYNTNLIRADETFKESERGKFLEVQQDIYRVTDAIDSEDDMLDILDMAIDNGFEPIGLLFPSTSDMNFSLNYLSNSSLFEKTERGEIDYVHPRVGAVFNGPNNFKLVVGETANTVD